MSENLEAQAQEQENSVETEVQQSESNEQPKQDVDKLFARMKSAEEEKKELKSQLNELLSKEKKREESKLAEEGEYKKLLENKDKELEEVMMKANKVDSLNAVVESLYQKKLENIPEEKRGMIPYQDDPVKALEYITQWESELLPQQKATTSPSTPKSNINPADDTEVAKARYLSLKDKMESGRSLSGTETVEWVNLSEQVGRI